MGLLKSFFTNCACPKGRMGLFMLGFMNKCHAPLTNWGLNLIPFENGWTMLDIGCGGGATLRRLLKRSDAGFCQTEIHRKKPSFATIIGING